LTLENGNQSTNNKVAAFVGGFFASISTLCENFCRAFPRAQLHPNEIKFSSFDNKVIEMKIEMITVDSFAIETQKTKWRYFRDER
jgi:hypothetical protein